MAAALGSTARNDRRLASVLLVAAFAASAVAACSVVGSSDTAAAADEYAAVVGAPVPDEADNVVIVSECRLDPLVITRFSLPRDAVANFLDASGFDEELTDGRVEIDSVPAQFVEEFESIESFGSVARDDGSESVAVHVAAGDPAVVFVRAFTI
jgi:hypothetical protein